MIHSFIHSFIHHIIIQFAPYAFFSTIFSDRQLSTIDHSRSNRCSAVVDSGFSSLRSSSFVFGTAFATFNSGSSGSTYCTLSSSLEEHSIVFATREPRRLSNNTAIKTAFSGPV